MLRKAEVQSCWKRCSSALSPFQVAQNGMTVRHGKLVALYDAAREGERPAHSLSDGRGDAVVQRLDGLDVLGKHQGEALAHGWQVLAELSPASTELRHCQLGTNCDSF